MNDDGDRRVLLQIRRSSDDEETRGDMVTGESFSRSDEAAMRCDGDHLLCSFLPVDERRHPGCSSFLPKPEQICSGFDRKPEPVYIFSVRVLEMNRCE
nr:hypothetical protein Iba_chr13dCG6800 [Ipomoea batatas]